MLDFTAATVVYCVFVGALFCGLWIYHDRRSYWRAGKTRGQTAFHCIRCDAIYALPGSHVDSGGCPRCGHSNVRLRF